MMEEAEWCGWELKACPWCGGPLEIMSLYKQRRWGEETQMATARCRWELWSGGHWYGGPLASLIKQEA